MWLNAAGWSALAATGLAAGGVAVLGGAPPVIALPTGVLGTYAVLLVADHLRWRDMRTGIGMGGLDAASGERIVARLRAEGIEAVYEEMVFDGEEEGTTDVQRSIRCRNADRDAVYSVMREELGL